MGRSSSQSLRFGKSRYCHYCPDSQLLNLKISRYFKKGIKTTNTDQVLKCSRTFSAPSLLYINQPPKVVTYIKTKVRQKKKTLENKKSLQREEKKKMCDTEKLAAPKPTLTKCSEALSSNNNGTKSQSLINLDQ